MIKIGNEEFTGNKASFADKHPGVSVGIEHFTKGDLVTVEGQAGEFQVMEVGSSWLGLEPCVAGVTSGIRIARRPNSVTKK